MAKLLMFRSGTLALLHDRRAVTAIEYVLIAAFVGIAALSGALLIGKNLAPTFLTAASHI